MKLTKEQTDKFLSTVNRVYFDNICGWDYPDFSDAYVAEAEIEGPNGDVRDATEEELNLINENVGYFYDELYEQAF